MSAPQPLAHEPDDPSDGALVARARRGERAAIRAIVQRNNRSLFRLARSVLGHDAEAEDAVQEAYVRAFTHLGDFRGDSRLSTWLARIVLNEALVRRRRRAWAAVGGKPRRDSDDVEDERVVRFPLVPAGDPDPEQAAAHAEIRRLLERSIDGLGEPFRVVFVLREVERMSVEETARCLGIPPETVKTRLHRAKAKLRRELQDELAAVLADAFPFAGARCARLTQRVLTRLGLPP